MKLSCKLFVICLLTSFTVFGQKILKESLEAKRVTLPNGWKLSPHGSSIPLGDLPLNVAVSPNQKYLLVTNNGQSIQSLQLIDVASQQVLDSQELPKSWYGLKIAADNKTVFVSGGNDNVILVYEIQAGKLKEVGKIPLSADPKAIISPTGIEYDDAKGILYVVSKDNQTLYVIDAKTKEIRSIHKLPAEAFTCLLDKRKENLFISIWGARQVIPYQVSSATFLPAIAVGDHPNEMLLTKNGKFLFVANANDNSVSVVDLQAGKEIEVLNAALVPNSLEGSSTNGLALSADEERLYVSNADNNCLAVFEVENLGNSRSLGFIPVGWYPTALKVVKGKLFVANGKGFSSFANPDGPNPIEKNRR